MNREVHNEQEMLDEDEQAVRRLVSGLKHVEAPANFERRVMGKIANGRPRPRGFFAIPAIGYAVPTLLVLLIAAFFVFKFRQSTPAESVPVNMAKTSVQPQAVPSAPSSQTPETTIAEGGPYAGQPKANNQKLVKARTNVDSNQGGGSILEGLHEKKRPMPEGIDPNSRLSANSNDVMRTTPISVKELLDALGMSVEFENGWRVKSITDNGAAQRIGIKVGDVINALDGRGIDASTTFNGFGSVHSVTVNRDGKLIPLKLTIH